MKGVSSKKLADLIAMFQIPVPFSFVHFRDIVIQFAQHVPQITQDKAEILMVAGPCFKCRKPGHIANDCVQQREPPTCYRCNKVGHIATKCRPRDVYCTKCKNSRHVKEACHTKRSRTTAATAGSAPRINATPEADQQAHRVPSGSEELWTVSQRMTVSAFATAAVSTSASGSNNFSPEIKVLVDTGNYYLLGYL